MWTDPSPNIYRRLPAPTTFWFICFDFFDTVAESYGVDSDLGVADDPEANEDPEGVEVPATELDISLEQTTELQSTVNDNFAIDIFMQTLEVLRSFFS